jgi:predicted DNA-binding WGR domain protein
LQSKKNNPRNNYTRYFRYEDDKSSKFWEITLSSATITTAWGRTGGRAQQRTRSFPRSEDAEAFANRIISEKLEKGYTETDFVRLEKISNEAIKIAETLRFVGTEGGPLMVLPEELLPSWNGVYDAEGRYIYETDHCDYTRACEWEGSWIRNIVVGEGIGLVLHSDSAASFLPDDTGGVFIRWSAADSAAPLVHALLRAPKSKWKRTGISVKVGPSQGLVLFDAARKGSGLKDLPGNEFMERGMRWALRVELARGTYAVDQIDNIQGRLLHGSQPTDFSTELTRLRLLG